MEMGPVESETSLETTLVLNISVSADSLGSKISMEPLPIGSNSATDRIHERGQRHALWDSIGGFKLIGSGQRRIDLALGALPTSLDQD